MPLSLLRNLCILFVISACTASSRNDKPVYPDAPDPLMQPEQPVLTEGQTPRSFTELARTPEGGYILEPGYYEAEFKTYCLQPGTPDPRPGDAYLQGPVTGHRREMVETVLLNSRRYPEMSQRNIQLLLWSIVSGSDFNKLSFAVQSDAMQLLTAKQIFQLKGGVMGAIKTVSQTTGLWNVNNDMRKLFEIGNAGYETYERLAVRREASQILRQNVKADQWYKQKEHYFIRYFPASYQQVRIQLYVPENLLDSAHQVNGEYIVFDPTGKQAIPAFTNAQRLGIGAPVRDIIKVIIDVNKRTGPAPKRLPPPPPAPKGKPDNNS